MAWGEVGPGKRPEDERGGDSLSRVRTQREDTERRGVRENRGDGGCVGYTLLAPPNFPKTPAPSFFMVPGAYMKLCRETMVPRNA